jgi:hypothetical protein
MTHHPLSTHFTSPRDQSASPRPSQNHAHCGLPAGNPAIVLAPPAADRSMSIRDAVVPAVRRTDARRPHQNRGCFARKYFQVAPATGGASAAIPALWPAQPPCGSHRSRLPKAIAGCHAQSASRERASPACVWSARSRHWCRPRSREIDFPHGLNRPFGRLELQATAKLDQALDAGAALDFGFRIKMAKRLGCVANSLRGGTGQSGTAVAISAQHQLAQMLFHRPAVRRRDFAEAKLGIIGNVSNSQAGHTLYSVMITMQSMYAMTSPSSIPLLQSEFYAQTHRH